METGTQGKLFLLKENNEDFEWYPTTDEMIKAIFSHCGHLSSILDVGAGDGRVLEQVHNLNRERAKKRDSQYSDFLDKYAIEISLVHIENMPPDISIIGTDFRSQTLIDKKVDVVFCNPPYSEYEEWATKIIKEANAKKAFLVIPQRWVNSKLIKQALKQRSATSKVIWSGDFMEADRQARAKVDIVEILITDAERDYEREKTDPFDVWFTEYFSGFEKLTPVDDDEQSEKPNPLKEIVEGQNLVERLSKLYTDEMASLLNNYKTLSQLDASLLTEIGVSTDEIRKALKLKIEGLKNKYWKELFDHLDKITNRLTSASRQSMLEKLNASCNVDFSVDNAYAVVLWVIKNANGYLDEQLITVFKELSEPECVKNYKSNLKTWEKDGWRYHKDHTNYMLDYRIVTSQYFAIKTEQYGYDYTNNLSRKCHSFINDIFTIANNLGFSMASWENSRNRQWESNKEQVFYFGDKVLAKIRAFKNGNLHLKLDQDFIKTLNVEASRLLGWIKSPQEAVDEMGIDLDFAKSKFRSNLLFGVMEGQKLLSA